MDNIILTTNFSASCYYDEAKKIRFDPPVYEQRYWTVLRLLELEYWKDSFKKATTLHDSAPSVASVPAKDVMCERSV
uniref:Uncharacterized protein n=1 Tax=Anopheles dirus TaxID=7168 RepID=A0A182NGW5_9DIPT